VVNSLATVLLQVRITLRMLSRLVRWRIGAAVGMGVKHRRLPCPPFKVPATPVSVALGAPTVDIPTPGVYGDVIPASFSRLPKTMPVIPLRTVSAENVVLFPNHIISASDGQLLPETLQVIQPSRRHVAGWTLSPPRAEEWRKEPEDVFLVDCGWHHFGHILLEAVPKLLMLDQAPRTASIATSIKSDWFYRVMLEFGVPPERIRTFDRVLAARHAYLPTSPIAPEIYCHPLGLETFDRLAAAFRPAIAPAERVFISRGSKVLGRRLLNQAEIEGIFADRGFTIFYPELHPFEEQIATISSARLLAGLGGSAIHMAACAAPGTRVLIVNSDRWLMGIDPLLHRVSRELAYVFGEGKQTSGDGGRTAWTVNPEAVRSAIAGHFGL
jgi:hypothetical protein